MRTPLSLIAAMALLLPPLAARATNVKLPIEGATLNITLAIQTQALLTEAGTPDGTGWATDIYARRTRLLVNGDINANFSYYFQLDNPNFGKFGDYGATKRLIAQDAFVSWAPTGKTGGTVVYLDAGLFFYPFNKEVMTGIGNKGTAEGHTDLARGFPGGAFPGNRTEGLQLRGWAFDKMIGFRGGIYEGQQPGASTPTINIKKNPAFAGLVNINILGTQEGAYTYQGIYFSKVPLLSFTVAASYQSQALVVPKGVTDQQSLHGHLFLEYPMSEDQEVIVYFTGYRYNNGSGSKDTGIAWSADLAFRYKWIKPYVSYEQFTSDDCPAELIGPAATACYVPSSGAHSADSRNFRGGVDLYFNKAQNHLNIEFSVNHGQSAFGPQAITSGTAGYVPLSLEPATTGGPRRAIDTTLASPAFKSILLNWYVTF
jgi:hypothetical protein